MNMEGKFNHGTLIKTRHKADNSWSICKSKTLKKLHLEQTTPKPLHDLMVNNNDPKLTEAKEKFRAHMARLSTPVDVDLNNIELDLVNIKEAPTIVTKINLTVTNS